MKYLKPTLHTLLCLAIVVLTACGNDTPAPRPTVAPIVIGQDIVIPAIGTQDPQPATNSYPFSRWITLPAGTQQLSLFEAPGGTTWIGTFTLPSTSLAAVEALRREAESKGLRTISISTGAGGFSLHGDLEGIIQVQSFDATSQTILIALTKLPGWCTIQSPRPTWERVRERAVPSPNVGEVRERAVPSPNVGEG